MKKLLRIGLTSNLADLHYEDGSHDIMPNRELVELINNLRKVNRTNQGVINEFNDIVVKLLQDKQELAAKLREERAKLSMIRGGFKDEPDNVLDEPEDKGNIAHGFKVEGGKIED